MAYVGDMTPSVLVLPILVGGIALTGCGSGAKPTAQYTTSPPTTIAGVSVVAGTQQPGIALDHRIGPVSFAERKPQVTKALGPGVAARLDGHLLRLYPKVGIYVAYPPNPPKGKQTIAFFIVTRSARYKTPLRYRRRVFPSAATTWCEGEVLSAHSDRLSAREGEHQPAVHRVQR